MCNRRAKTTAASGKSTSSSIYLFPEQLPVDSPRLDVLERVAVEPGDARGVLHGAGAESRRRGHRGRKEGEEGEHEDEESEANEDEHLSSLSKKEIDKEKMAQTDGDADAVHVLDVDSDLGEPPLDSAARSAAAAAEMPPPSTSSSSNRASSSTPSPSISASSTSTSSSSKPLLSDRNVATGGALLLTLLLLLIGKNRFLVMSIVRFFEWRCGEREPDPILTTTTSSRHHPRTKPKNE